MIDVPLSLESRVSVSSDTYSNFQNWHRWNEYCSFCLTRQMSPFHITYESRIEIHFFFSPSWPFISFFLCVWESSTVLFASMPHSVIIAAAWLTQWVYELQWVTKKWGQVECKVPTHSIRKEMYWYSILSHHITIVFIRYMYTLVYENMLTIYLRNHPSKTIIRITTETIIWF